MSKVVGLVLLLFSAGAWAQFADGNVLVADMREWDRLINQNE